jgi:hypothetical protein
VTLSDTIQTAAVLAAVGASIIALVISYLDRRNARAISARDRREALRDEQLLFEQGQLLRLLENLRRGGSTDALERSRMGGEAAGIIGMMGPERLPMNWAGRVLDERAPSLEEFIADESRPEWQRRGVEVQIELNRVTDEIRQRLAENS